LHMRDNTLTKFKWMRFAHDACPCLFQSKESQIAQIRNLESGLTQDALDKPPVPWSFAPDQVLGVVSTPSLEIPRTRAGKDRDLEHEPFPEGPALRFRRYLWAPNCRRSPHPRA
ncbi:MAG: hypothetical protein AAF666_20375, partial [Pseudomonadota bacterium]